MESRPILSTKFPISHIFQLLILSFPQYSTRLKIFWLIAPTSGQS
nr:MAG TPA: hypothetical protein [Bacteriophage sp.]DAY34951.1 MAG TPA: hypothetical protein [Bacteriophage sp.]